MGIIETLLGPVFNPLLGLGPFWAIIIVGFIVSFLITIIYKFATNQKLMKSLKGELKESQNRMKELRDNPEQMMAVQKEAMKKNMEYMKHSFKPTLITFLPIILIFGWMGAHLAFEPIYPGETFSMTAVFEEGVSGIVELVPDAGVQIDGLATQDISREVTWKLKSSEGLHTIDFRHGDQTVSKKVLITKELLYEPAETVIAHSDLEKVRINYNKLKPLGSTSIFGWQPGWLGIYIITSIFFSMGLRKLMKLH